VQGTTRMPTRSSPGNERSISTRFLPRCGANFFKKNIYQHPEDKTLPPPSAKKLVAFRVTELNRFKQLYGTLREDADYLTKEVRKSKQPNQQIWQKRAHDFIKRFDTVGLLVGTLGQVAINASMENIWCEGHTYSERIEVAQTQYEKRKFRDVKANSGYHKLLKSCDQLRLELQSKTKVTLFGPDQKVLKDAYLQYSALQDSLDQMKTAETWNPDNAAGVWSTWYADFVRFTHDGIERGAHDCRVILESKLPNKKTRQESWLEDTMQRFHLDNAETELLHSFLTAVEEDAAKPEEDQKGHGDTSQDDDDEESEETRDAADDAFIADSDDDGEKGDSDTSYQEDMGAETKDDDDKEFRRRKRDLENEVQSDPEPKRVQKANKKQRNRKSATTTEVIDGNEYSVARRGQTDSHGYPANKANQEDEPTQTECTESNNFDEPNDTKCAESNKEDEPTVTPCTKSQQEDVTQHMPGPTAGVPLAAEAPPSGEDSEEAEDKFRREKPQTKRKKSNKGRTKSKESTQAQVENTDDSYETRSSPKKKKRQKQKKKNKRKRKRREERYDDSSSSSDDTTSDSTSSNAQSDSEADMKVRGKSRKKAPKRKRSKDRESDSSGNEELLRFEKVMKNNMKAMKLMHSQLKKRRHHDNHSGTESDSESEDTAPKKKKKSRSWTQAMVEDPQFRLRHGVKDDDFFYHCFACDQVRKVERNMMALLSTDENPRLVDQTKEPPVGVNVRSPAYKRMKTHIREHLDKKLRKVEEDDFPTFFRKKVYKGDKRTWQKKGKVTWSNNP
jgi:hypothetical protein